MDQSSNQTSTDEKFGESFSSIAKTCAVVGSGIVLSIALIVKVQAGEGKGSDVIPFGDLEENVQQSSKPQVQGIQTQPVGPDRPAYTSTPSQTPSPSPEPSSTPTSVQATNTPTPTPQQSSSQSTSTPTPTNSPTPTITVSPTATQTPTISVSPT